MPASRSIARLLARHKSALAREVAGTGVLARLVAKGVLTEEEQSALKSDARTREDGGTGGDMLVDTFARKGFDAFRELCVTLEVESPHLLTSLLLDSQDVVGESIIRQTQPHSRENSALSASNLPISPKFNNRDLELNRSPSAGSLSGVGHNNNHQQQASSSSIHNNVNNNSSSNGMLSEDGYATLHKSDENKPSQSALEEMHELLEEPVEEELEMGSERIAWEFHHVQLSRMPGYGFGIAVSGGRDNPHFTNGDPSIAISDVLKAGPAEGKLQINDRVITANNTSLEGVDYATAVQVLRDSGQTVNLVVKRRVVLPPTQLSVNANPDTQHVEQQQGQHDLRVTLSRSRKSKEDFGVVLGCHIYIKEISRQSTADREGTLREGDLLSRINGQSTEGMTLKEARKLLDASKDRLNLIVRRDGTKKSSMLGRATNTNGGIYPLPQNDTPPRLPPPPKDMGDIGDEGYASSPVAKAVEPYIAPENSDDLPDPRFISFKKDVSVGIRLTGGNEVGIFVTAVQPGSPASKQGLRPGDKILKVNEKDMKGVTREDAVLYLLSLQDHINLIAQYRKNEYDQIVMLQRGDSFHIKAHFNNDSPEKSEMPIRKSDIFHVVDTLHNGIVGSWQVFRMGPFLNDSTEEHQQVKKGVIPNKTRAEEIATLVFNAAKKEQSGGTGSSGGGATTSKSSFFRRRREKSRLRSKSLGKRDGERFKDKVQERYLHQYELDGQKSSKSFYGSLRFRKRDKVAEAHEDHWEDLVWSESMSKFPAYEHVSWGHPGFSRPVVIFGPVADLVRQRLLKDYPTKFASPQNDSSSDDNQGTKSGIIRLSSIREVIDQGKHALLDVTPNAVDKLSYAQLYPIVIFTRTDSKQTIKDCRAGLPKKSHLSSRKLLEQCQKLDKLWRHIFTAMLDLSDVNWYNKLVDLLEKQQTAPVWMSETKPEEPVSDDFLFPMSSASARLSYYNSSPESDGEFCTDTTPRNSRTHLAGIVGSSNTLSSTGIMHAVASATKSADLARSTSDPSIAPKDEEDKSGIPDYHIPPPHAITPKHHQDDKSHYYQNGVTTISNGMLSPGGDSQYGFSRGSTNHNHPHNHQPHTNPYGSNGHKLLPQQNSNHHRHHHKSPSSRNRLQSQADSVDDLPLPPPPPPTNNSHSPPSSMAKHRSVSQPPNRESPPDNNFMGQSGSPATSVPPKIDRHKKPSRRSSSSVNHGEGLYSSVNGRSTSNETGERNPHMRDNKMSAYKSVPSSSSAYDAYQSLDNVEGGRPRSMGYTSLDSIQQQQQRQTQNQNGSVSSSRGSSQDPGYRSSVGLTNGGSSQKYRYGPTSSPGHTGADNNDKYRYADYKPVPPPKTTVYKPVPPPKPKSYPSRTPIQPASLPEGNYMNSGPPPQSLQTPNGNGHYNDYMRYKGSPQNGFQPPNGGNRRSYHQNETDSNGPDSGQGSSLDREYSGNNNGGQYRYANPPSMMNGNSNADQYYCNLPLQQQQQQPVVGNGNAVPPSPRKNGDGLDLTGNRECRGSAFELYKKPQQLHAPQFQPGSVHQKPL